MGLEQAGGRDESGFVGSAEAFGQDLPDAEIHLLDGGHFLLESACDDVARLTRNFLARQGQA